MKKPQLVSLKRWREALMNDTLYERVVWLEQIVEELELENRYLQDKVENYTAQIEWRDDLLNEGSEY